MNTTLSQWILETTIYGSATIAVVLALAPLIRRWLGAQAAHALWLIVLIRLLIPWSPAWDIPRVPIEPSRWSTPASPFANAQVSVSVSNASTLNISPIIPISSSRPSINWPLTAWAGGSIAMLVFLALRAARAARLVHRARDITSETLIQRLLTEVGASSRKLRVRETRELQSPALCGLFRPTIVLPTGWSDQITSTELRHILSHEYGHLRRGDLWWKWAFQLATALHWFNPLVWLAARVARTDQEMACDEWVLSHHPNTNISQYGNTLITTSRRLNRSALTSPIHAGMAETKAGLTRRIRQIAHYQPHSWKATIASVSLIIILWLSFGPAKTNAEPSPNLATQFEITPTPPPTPLSPPKPKYTQVEIEAKFVSIPVGLAPAIFGPERRPILNSAEYQKILGNLNQWEGCDLLSTPRVTVKSGLKAIVKIVREFPYPTGMTVDSRDQSFAPSDFETASLGVTLDVEPHIAPDDTIMCSLTPRVADFVGFVNYGSGFPARSETAPDALSAVLHPSAPSAQVINQPVFETRSTTVSVALKSGETVVLGDMGANASRISGVIEAAQNRWSTPKAASAESAGQRNEFYAFITMRLVDQERTVRADHSTQLHSTQAAPSGIVINSQSGLPYGTAVPGKPGYATSPYAPTSGYVDLRGFPAGAEVRCPYTGRLFLVP